MDAQLTILFGLLFIILALIGWFDLKTLTIPNWLNGTLFAVGLFAAWSIAPSQLPVHLMAAIIVTCGFYLIRYAHLRIRGVVGFGLGDVKMMGAAAMWISPFNIPYMVMVSSLTAITAIVVLYYRETAQDITAIKLPFGPFIASGLLVVWVLEKTAWKGMQF